MNLNITLNSNNLENTKAKIDVFSDLLSKQNQTDISFIHNDLYQLNSFTNALHLHFHNTQTIEFTNNPAQLSTKGFFIICFKSNKNIELKLPNRKSTVFNNEVAYVLRDDLPFTISLNDSYSGNWVMIHFSANYAEYLQVYTDFSNEVQIIFEGLNLYYFHQFLELKKLKRNDMRTNQLLTLKLLTNQIMLDLHNKKHFFNEKFILEEVKGYLLANLLGACPTLETLSRIAGMSVSSLKTKFKIYVGISPKQFFFEAQMTKALSMLKEGHSVKQIASSLGFVNASNFINAFKRKFHISPNKMIS